VSLIEDRSSSEGRLCGAIANAAVQVHRNVVGRGPETARAICRDNVVLVLLQQVFTKAELTLAERGRHDVVLDTRAHLHDVMRPGLIAAVEGLTGARVVALMASAHVDPSYVAQVFVLDRPAAEMAQSTSLDG
jgi:uncharacterized protein YbcI